MGIKAQNNFRLKFREEAFTLAIFHLNLTRRMATMTNETALPSPDQKDRPIKTLCLCACPLHVFLPSFVAVGVKSLRIRSAKQTWTGNTSFISTLRIQNRVPTSTTKDQSMCVRIRRFHLKWSIECCMSGFKLDGV